MGDDKPFECTVSGCGMKFTNEDHLTVHKTKHQLTLTLASNDFKSGLPGFVDQTPTPSKFLKNFEEVTLFHDFSKNPFEEAFKKATEHPSPCAELESSATTSPSVYDTLNTPNPGFLVASVMDLKNSENQSSIQIHHHQQQQNVLIPSSEHSFYLLPSPCPTSATSDQNSEWSEIDVDHPNHSQQQHSHQQQHVETNQSTVNNGVENVLFVANGSLPQSMMNLNSVSVDSGCITYLLANDALVPVTLPTFSVNDSSLVTPNEAINNDTQEVISAGHKTQQTKTENSSVTDGRQLIKIQPSPSASLSSSSRSMVGKVLQVQAPATKSCIAKSTKEKLKAAIQNNAQQQHTSNCISDLVNFSHHKQRASTVAPSSSCSSSGWNVSYVVSNAEAREIEECEDVVGSLLTSKKICIVPVENEKDDKRRKFLERNRAAAARCRQKKKVWMNTLALKSEQLEASNLTMQSELKQLRREVQVLRSLLEAHKECPVTLKQRALKEEMQSDHVTSSSHAVGTGVGVVITTSDEEMAMNALSSMANYHAC